MEKPRVIFLDAVGTLFGVQGSVGEVYSAIANQFGVTVPASALDKAFVKAFASAEPAVFPETDPEEIPQREFEWWWVIASRTFEQVGVLDQFTDFIDFFDELYGHFATAQPWFIYPDVIPALKAWQHIGIELGVVSNFDSRLHLVLKALKLEEFFSSITISTQTGFAKPDPQIFAAALQKHHCTAQEAFHIGDSFQEDYQGAQAARLRAFLIKRKPIT
ncbi:MULTISPECIES: HAD family hydrolase [Moorena]|uniref:HAD superfamily hydrolase n=1 Tax=Moorena producens 3L TaxID=489825 RepID=F4XPI0_9CYAN|nr:MULTISPECIES: HAD family hydrolase [Moorena]NEQ15043.1 HAD family hydrolase [Moorena sp. SIO3E2]EGJ33434.1 HAD superfamily hydrolase [Moorena producens 3L]NEP31469.1 HAD family hydrolase [Moorena sp. SIO3B2]NEP65217.1 HAD family hydrolase [Moorena sp. SIO3A5]NEQ04597.1 HAD family hydrolase [Moorena sp. SIO4E2]